MLDGDREAYRQVIELCEVKVWIVLVAILPDPDSVDDLAQETFIHAYERLSEYRPGTDFYAWAKEIARNLALNERRRWIRRQTATRRYRTQIAESLEPELLALSERETGDAGSLRHHGTGDAHPGMDQYPGHEPGHDSGHGDELELSAGLERRCIRSVPPGP